MHINRPNIPEKPMLPLHDQNAHIAPFFDGLVAPIINPRMPFTNVDIRPSNACPRNFIIFDQTNNRSKIMLHPEMTPKMLYPIFQQNVDSNDANDEREASSQVREGEDSDDIDALLSTEYEDGEESGDDVSTARTNAVYECSSPDSCSNYDLLSRKIRKKSSGSYGNEKKREKMRKMVKALRAIVPGANRMSSVAVLDEAVRYLKSLRVEVKKIGVES